MKKTRRLKFYLLANEKEKREFDYIDSRAKDSTTSMMTGILVLIFGYVVPNNNTWVFAILGTLLYCSGLYKLIMCSIRLDKLIGEDD